MSGSRGCATQLPRTVQAAETHATLLPSDLPDPLPTGAHRVIGTRAGELVCMPCYVPQARQEAFLAAGVGVVYLPIPAA